MGRPDDAHAIVEKLRAITPQVVPSFSPFRNPEDRELLLSGRAWRSVKLNDCIRRRYNSIGRRA
jgi:hypothetical protein